MKRVLVRRRVHAFDPFCAAIFWVILCRLTCQGQTQAPPENWVYPPSVVAWDDATKQTQEVAAKKLADDLKSAIGRGDKQFVVAPGEYRLGGSLLPFLVITAKDLDIRAEGAHFWFSGRIPQTAVTFQDCSNVQFHGATFDADPFCNSQGEVLSIDPNTKTVVVRIDPGFPLPDAKWLGKPGSSKAIFCDPKGAFRQTTLDWVKETTSMGGGQFRVSFLRGQIFDVSNEVKPGDRLVFPDRSMGHVFALSHCEKVTLEDITIYAAPHMALTETGGAGGNIYRRCKVVRRPDTRRLIACNADVFHSIKVEHGPLIEQCEFSESCDDIINVHSFASWVLGQSAPTKAVMVAFLLPDIETGCTLEFYDFDTMQSVGVAKVLRATARPDLDATARSVPGNLIVGGRKVADIFHDKCFPVEVELDHPLTLPKFAFAFSSLHVARGTVIRDNVLHDTIGRGIFAKCEDALIQNNQIDRIGMPGILMATDRYFWEGPPPQRVAVRDNRLSEVAISGGARMAFNGMNAAIAVGNKDEGGAASPASESVTNIVLENNRIERTPVTAILLENARGCSIMNNTMTQLGFLPPLREATPELKEKAAAIYVAQARDIHIAGNTLQQTSAPSGRLIVLGKDTVNCGPQK